MANNQTHAFSLIELSIVLVILGLLTGGILAGQSLIRASELRTVNADIQRYSSSAYAFRDKYFAIPGDIAVATRFWGDDNTNCPDAAVANGTPGTCNGNGDGILEGAAAASATGESFQYWKHLALAGLIEGSYTGLAGPSSGYHVLVNVNTPASKIGASAAFNTRFNTVGSGGTLHFSGAPSGNFMYLGGITSGNTDGDQPVLRAEDAWNIDTKMDDGKPGTGTVTTYKQTSRPQCVNSDDRFTAEYLLTSTAIGCNMRFKLP